MNKLPKLECGGCRTCCIDDTITILPGEDRRNWLTEQKHTDRGLVWVLRHKPNGECVYLTETGCGIHGRAPIECRQFDCREMARRLDALPRAQRRFKLARNKQYRRVIEEGRRRLTLTA